MTFTLKIRSDNAAFDAPREEVARILRETADKLDYGREGGLLHDINGNRVGTFEMVQS